jgi:hypothetical protein
MRLAKKLPSIKRNDGTMKTISTSAYTPRNYKRIFLNQAVLVLGMYANRQTQILLYLLSNADKGNMIYCTYKDIMADCSINDKKVVAKVLKELQKIEAIVKVSQSHYMLNPALMMAGNNQKYGLLAITFNSFLKSYTDKKTEDNRDVD